MIFEDLGHRKDRPVAMHKAELWRLIEWRKFFKIDPDRNKGAKLTPSAATLPEVTPDQEAKRWVSLLSGELDTHPLPAKRYKPGQYVVIFEKDMPNFRFGRVATPPAESSGSGSD